MQAIATKLAAKPTEEDTPPRHGMSQIFDTPIFTKISKYRHHPNGKEHTDYREHPQEGYALSRVLELQYQTKNQTIQEEATAENDQPHPNKTAK